MSTYVMFAVINDLLKSNSSIIAKRKDDKNYLQIRGKTSGLVLCLPEGGAAVVIVGKHLQRKYCTADTY
jgi:hypothetical protein